jgi:hypothetical protein
MKIKLDLGQFKLKNNDGKIATLIHPDGHEFRVAVGALHPENRKNLDSLSAPDEAEATPTEQTQSGGQPKKFAEGGYADSSNQAPMLKANSKKPRKAYADGGEIDYGKADYANEPPAPDAPYGSGPPSQAPVVVNVGAQGSSDMPQDGQSTPVASSPGAAPQAQEAAPQASQAPSMASEPAPDDITGSKTHSDALSQGLGMQSQAADVQARAAMDQASAQKNIAQQQINNEQQNMATAQKHYADYDNASQQMIKNIEEHKIDPNHLWASKETPAKIGTVIGLILGGMGSGLTGGENPVLKMLNQQIDRDMDAQKTELGKKENLYGALQSHYKSTVEADAMFRAIKNNQIAAQLDKAAAAAKSPQALAQAQAFKGQLLANNAQGLGQLAAMKTAMGQMDGSGTAGGKSNMDPARLVQAMVPKEHQEAVFKELERADNTRKAADSILSNFDEVTKQMQSAGGLGRVGSAVYPVAQKGALMEQLGTTVSDKVGTIREKAMQLAEHAYVPTPTDTAERIATKRKELVNYLRLQSAAPRSKGYNIDIDKFNNTARTTGERQLTPQQQSFADYARKNPQDPRSAAVLKKLGIQ